MWKLASWLIGFSLGAAVGAVLVMLFAPVSGDEVVTRLKQGWEDTLLEARQANIERRAELEAELVRLKAGQPAP